MTTTREAGTVVALAGSEGFKDLCEAHEVKPTRRQASKFLNGYGALVRARDNDPDAIYRLYARRKAANEAKG